MPKFDPTLIDIQPYDGDQPGRPTAVVCDLDGTIANHDHRHWTDYAKVGQDAPIINILELIGMEAMIGTEVIFMSGRDDTCYDETLDWIERHLGNVLANPPLYMRKAGDNRPDFVVKEELFQAHVAGQFNVARVYDDRDQVVALWRHKGLTCLQTAYGDF